MPVDHSRVANHQVIVVGAGAAGVGVGVALKDAGVEDVLILDRHEVGASFARWPKEMSFLTPSFPANSVGILDLNAVALRTSPAYTTGQEHPDGPAYAKYLRAISSHFELATRFPVDVHSVEKEEAGYALETSDGRFSCQYLIWAAGEFQYPNQFPFTGAKHCVHNSHIRSFRDCLGDDAIVIGGYESGVDSAIQLAAFGKKVTVLSRNAPWTSKDADPSVSLSIYTRERLNTISKLGGEIEFIGEAEIVRVRKLSGDFQVQAKDGRQWTSKSQPILATGFVGSHRLLGDLCELRDDGYPRLTEHDESTTTPGLFFCGPIVRHDEQVFCFVYKFRMRFAVVAKAIATGLGLEAQGLEEYRNWGMYLDDLSCCGEECVCEDETEPTADSADEFDDIDEVEVIDEAQSHVER